MPHPIDSCRPMNTKQEALTSFFTNIDFLIITPLAEERDAVLSKLPAPLKTPPTEQDIRVYYKSILPVLFSDNTSCDYSIVVTDLHRMGRIDAAICTGEAIRRWQPRYVLLVGIAGGVSDAGVNLGDVLVADLVADYETQKLKVDGPSIRWRTYNVDPRLLVAANQMKSTDWISFISESRPNAGTVTQHCGPICTGDKIVANDDLINQHRDVWTKLIGIEMEAGGVAPAAFQATPAPGFFMIRGVSDLADKEKETTAVKEWRSYACDVAAAFTVAFLRRGPIPPDTRQAQSVSLVTQRKEGSNLRKQELDDMEAILLGRCVGRWQSVGVSKSIAVQFAKDPLIGEPTEQMYPDSEKPLKVLVGEIGSGKTLFAYRLFQNAILRARLDENAPWPIFFEAKDVVGKLRDSIENKSAGHSLKDNGAFVVIDGADEAGSTAIDQLLSEARTLTALPHLPLFIIITCRPIGDLNEKAKEELVQVPSLSEEKSWKLIERISEHAVTPGLVSGWPESLKEATRRPLFAILFGNYLQSHSGNISFSMGEILDHLVEKAISGATIDINRAKSMLERLATLSTEREGGPVPMREIGSRMELGPLLESRLVVDKSGSINFPLAILREWFGAQALFSDEKVLQEALNSSQLIDAWHNSFVIAIATFDHDRVSKLLKPLAERYPGIASSLVHEALSSWGFHEESFTLPALECGRRVRESMQAWMKGIGSLAALIAPIREDGSLCSAGVRLEKNVLLTSWYRGKDDVAEIVELAKEQVSLNSSDWPGYRWARPTQQAAWAWKWTLEELAHNLSYFVKNKRLPTADGSILDEILWPQLVRLNNHGLSWEKLIKTPIRTRINISKTENMLKQIEANDSSDLNGEPYPLNFLKEQLHRLHSQGIRTIYAPWPQGDRNIRGSYVWSDYSDDQLLSRASVVYEKALIAYKQMVEDWFPSLSPRLQTYVLMPVRVVGLVVPATKSKNPPFPSLAWHLEPLPINENSVVKFKLGNRNSFHWPDRQCLDEKQAIFAARRPNAEKWMSVGFSSGILDIFGSFPITDMAYRWLEDDLKKIAWIK